VIVEDEEVRDWNLSFCNTLITEAENVISLQTPHSS